MLVESEFERSLCLRHIYAWVSALWLARRTRCYFPTLILWQRTYTNLKKLDTNRNSWTVEQGFDEIGSEITELVTKLSQNSRTNQVFSILPTTKQAENFSTSGKSCVYLWEESIKWTAYKRIFVCVGWRIFTGKWFDFKNHLDFIS